MAKFQLLDVSLVVFVLWIFLDTDGARLTVRGYDAVFSDNYNISWGEDHVMLLNQGLELHLILDNYSGSGFESKLRYGSGFFHTDIKTPRRDTSGTVTTFYLRSDSGAQDELDFEFLGDREGHPISLQTNVFVKGQGNREERINLWFDPSQDFHSYRILWNANLIIFLVDNIPIRVYMNKMNEGVAYPSQPMQIIASLWDGDDWATNGGQAKINWTDAPFVASFKGFAVDGCPAVSTGGCDGSQYWWNQYSKLTEDQVIAYTQVRGNLTYDYCNDRGKHPVVPPECPQL